MSTSPEKSLAIAVVGPVFPYKGGISYYTGMLAKELAKRHNVSVFSFSLQYPRFLYPGEKQTNHEDISQRINGTNYCLNSINPWSWVKTGLALAKKKPDLVIIPWWNPFFSPAFSVISLLVKRLSRARVMFIIHNVLPHERMPCERLITAFTLKRGDFHLIQSAQSEAPLLELLPHPVYRKALLPAHHVATDNVISREEARHRISVPSAAKVLLFFGFVRDYKGLLYLLEALPAIRAALPEARLLIAGEFHDDKAAYVQKIKESGVADMVDLHDGYIPGSKMYQYFRAADLAVLPYASATQSGIVQIAFGFGTPVVVTSVGGLPEVVADGRTGFVVPPKDAKALADAVIRFFKEDKRDQFSKAIETDRERFSWQRMVETIEEMVATSNRPE